MSTKKSPRINAGPPILVERTSLPRLLVRTKGEIRYHAYVHTYIIGRKTRVHGSEVTPLYYLSLVAMRGEGALLQGIWSALIANTIQDVYLDGVGTVVLAHHLPAYSDLEYTLHWNYHQTELPSQDLHAVIESHMLTMCDPIQGAAPAERERKRKKKEHGKPKKRAESQGKITHSTANKKELGATEEEINRQKHPMFLLMVPGNLQPERKRLEDEEAYATRCQQQLRAFLVEQHFAFLTLRTPWAMSSEWADYLWQRGLEREENTPLTVWSMAVPQKKQAEEDGQEVRSLPLIAQAWLCRPHIVLLPADLKRACLEGRIHLPVSDATPQPQMVAVAGR